MDIKTKKIKKRIVIALGGNAILDTESSGTYEDQIQRIRQTIQGLGDILQNPHNEIIITHGNGPQIGSLLIQNVHSTDVVPAMPMLLCSAMTEGSMGFLLTGEIRNALNTSLVKKSVVSIITTVEVDSKDASFKNLTKPIGPFYTKEESEALTKKLACTYKEDSGRGYRRVVPSPTPKRILEIDTICDILSTAYLL
jgi:carbamate kinase